MNTLRRTLSILLFVSLTMPLATVQAVDGTHFGDGNLPASCTGESTPGPHFTDSCYHMRTNLNDLDTPIIDVLLTLPVGPYAERDLRTTRQAIEMWDAGIQYLAPQMGLDWLGGVEFNIFLDDDTFTTDPAWDPEIVVVTINPAVTYVQGIGIDPLGFSAPCRGANPLASFEAWGSLPGFDSHHDGHSGTYVEECEGGGTTCYAVNVAIDPVPGVVEDVLGINLFDLVTHEVGHCLSIGHVGDAGDHTAAAVPVDDIMSYTHNNAPGKCVSTLDVESFALRMSKFLLPTPLVANHASDPDGRFQIQHPSDHYYASSTGLALDCPKPDTGLVPLREPVNFTPENGLRRSPPALAITSHDDGDHAAAGIVNVAGTVMYGAAAGDQDGDGVLDGDDNCPADFNPGQSDGDNDGTGDACDPTDGAFPTPDGQIRGGITIFSDLNPVAAHNELVGIGTGAAGDPKPKFLGGEPVTFQSRFTTAPAGLVSVNNTTFTWHLWNAAGDLVTTIPCRTSADSSAGVANGFNCKGSANLPAEAGHYYASARLDNGTLWIADDPNDDTDHPGLKGLEVLPVAIPTVPTTTSTITFEDDGDPVNTFYADDSTLGVMGAVIDTSEYFTLELTGVSDVKIRLEWASLVGFDDLDLYVTGAASKDSAEALTDFEEVVLKDVPRGTLFIKVTPYQINDPLFGAEYTLVAEVTTTGTTTDTDGDGVDDVDDLCANTPPETIVDATGCPTVEPSGERIVISVDGVKVATQAVDGRGGDTFSQDIDLTGLSGPVEVTVTWYDGNWIVLAKTITLVIDA